MILHFILSSYVVRVSLNFKSMLASNILWLHIKKNLQFSDFDLKLWSYRMFDTFKIQIWALLKFNNVLFGKTCAANNFIIFASTWIFSHIFGFFGNGSWKMDIWKLGCFCYFMAWPLHLKVMKTGLPMPLDYLLWSNVYHVNKILKYILIVWLMTKWQRSKHISYQNDGRV